MGTVFGGVGLKFAEHLLGKNKAKIDVATQMRDEMRIEIKELQKRVDELEETNDKWRARAWKAEEELAIRNALIASHGCMAGGVDFTNRQN
ncbi:hypothetical protein [Streptomyces sp. B1I3]|uniref:hypothetical protein n=1 Tax=Streptomyces sp. B1I3 TaxID=3042264 RepID=UPI0027827769|nr:hypothetical protein [Streptomyces sp. B1I3]MDQ0793550.1 hypothetical protein [Streptomyces sp. B1I3]